MNSIQTEGVSKWKFSTHPLPFIFYPKLLHLCGLRHEQSAKAWTDEPGQDHAGHNRMYDANL